jgi:hypothetical protein
VAIATPATNSVHVVVDNLGPNPVNGTFSRQTVPLSEGAIFTASGMSLRISYIGGDGNDITLTVLAVSGAGTTYASWIAGYPSLPASERDPGDDFDGDGMVNLLEYFAGLSPVGVHPPMMTALDGASGTVRFLFRRGRDIPDLSYVCEWSTNFVNWFPPDATHVYSETTVGGDAAHDQVRGTLVFPSGQIRLYVRLRIIGP